MSDGNPSVITRYTAGTPGRRCGRIVSAASRRAWAVYRRPPPYIILSIAPMSVLLSAVRGETTSDTPPSCEFTNTSALEKWVMPTSTACPLKSNDLTNCFKNSFKSVNASAPTEVLPSKTTMRSSFAPYDGTTGAKCVGIGVGQGVIGARSLDGDGGIGGLGVVGVACTILTGGAAGSAPGATGGAVTTFTGIAVGSAVGGGVTTITGSAVGNGPGSGSAGGAGVVTSASGDGLGGAVARASTSPPPPGAGPWPPAACVGRCSAGVLSGFSSGFASGFSSGFSSTSSSGFSSGFASGFSSGFSSTFSSGFSSGISSGSSLSFASGFSVGVSSGFSFGAGVTITYSGAAVVGAAVAVPVVGPGVARSLPLSHPGPTITKGFSGGSEGVAGPLGEGVEPPSGRVAGAGVLLWATSSDATTIGR